MSASAELVSTTTAFPKPTADSSDLSSVSMGASLPSATLSNNWALGMDATPPVPGTHQAQQADYGGEIWSTILGQAATAGTTKSVLCKTLLVCGENSAIKTALVDDLIRSSPGKTSIDTFDTSDMGLGYLYLDVNDDENEAVSRIGIYQLSGDPAYHSLTDFTLTNETISDSLAIITLDWNKPWQFVESLNLWLGLLEQHVDQISKENPNTVAELKQTLEAYYRGYTESDDTIHRIMGSTSDSFSPTQLEPSDRGADRLSGSYSLPLGAGVLNRNIGIPIIVVCLHAEVLIEHEKDYKEDRLDYIQQVLRTICLSFGASLFYISNQRPETMSNLRSYIFHRLLSNNPQTSIATDNVVTRPGLAGYEFTLPAQMIERDAVLIPSGWDSWGKIKVLRDGFPCEVYAGIHGSDSDPAFQAGATDILTKMTSTYQANVADRSSKISDIPPLIEPENDQDFLQKYLPLLMKLDEASRANSSATTSMASSPVSSPMTTVKLSVDRSSGNHPPSELIASKSQILSSREALDDLSAKVVKQQEAIRERVMVGTSIGDIAAKRILERAASSGTLPRPPSGGVSATGTASGSQEVLANFFQSLLAKKGAAGNVPNSKTSSPPTGRRSKTSDSGESQ
ncbi:hypothetical protein BASA60_010880 [Batrachochytrium salamandrivorans]|nr:hypothetical protein BASA60_010880 [Batrachochytrium salamandrivorans]